MIKTRVQSQELRQNALTGGTSERSTLLSGQTQRLGAVEITKRAYQSEGISVFFRGLGICSARAFIVNAVQWMVYEWMMHVLVQQKATQAI